MRSETPSSGDPTATVTLSSTFKQISSFGQTVGFFVTPKTTNGTWTATENVPWLSITTGGSGQGYGLVEATVQSNTSTEHRTGNITVGGVIFSVIQGKPIKVNGNDSNFTINTSSNAYQFVASVSATTGEVWTARCVSRSFGTFPTVSVDGGAYSTSVTGSGNGTVRSFVPAHQVINNNSIEYYDTTTVFEIGPIRVTIIQDIP